VQDHGLKQRAASGPVLLGDVADLGALVRIETEVQQATQDLEAIAPDGRFEYSLTFQVLLGAFFQIIPAAQGRGGDRTELSAVLQEKCCGTFELLVVEDPFSARPVAV
jgi:hypothetical protein